MERAARAEAEAAQPAPVVEEEEDSGSETEREEDYRTTVSRPKGESADDRKARKAAVKAERSVRRISLPYLRTDADK
jgi:protein LTV1